MKPPRHGAAWITREKHYGKCHSAKTGSPRRLRNRDEIRDDKSENVLVCEATSSDAYRVCAVTDVFTALALTPLLLPLSRLNVLIHRVMIIIPILLMPLH